MAEFKRPGEQFRYVFGGMNVKNTADALAPNKYPYAENIRAYSDTAVRTRPGTATLFTVGEAPTNLASYTALGTDSLPRFLAKTVSGKVVLDTGGIVDTGYSALPGSMIPYRPNQSPNPWMYIGDAAQYRKLSVPSANVVTAQNVGIVEPQSPLDAGLAAQLKSNIGVPGAAVSFTAGGTAGAAGSGSRASDTVGAVFTDPALPTLSTLQIGSAAFTGAGISDIEILNGGSGYTASPVVHFSGGGGSGAVAFSTIFNGEVVSINITNPGSGYTSAPSISFSGGIPGGGAHAVAYIGGGGAASSASYQRYMEILVGTQVLTVQDVFAPLPQPLTIQGIYYFSGSTGRCIVVPAGLTPSAGTQEQSIYSEAIVSSLRRGALVAVGSEVCYILGTSVGPDGTIAFETSTTGTHTTAETLAGIPAIQVIGTVSVGDTIASATITSTLASGVGYLTATLASNPFVTSATSFSEDDLLHISLSVDAPASVNEFKILIDVSDGTFSKDYYWYAIRPSDLTPTLANTLTTVGIAQLALQRAQLAAGASYFSTQATLGAGQFSEIMFSLRNLVRVGNDQTRTLQNAVSIRIQGNVSASVALAFNSVTILGGYQPDVGEVGAPYTYYGRPRSSVTGAKGNPSPLTRYGVSPRRARVAVITPTTYPDPQMDTWDIFRLGGTLDKPRFVGQTSLATGVFYDNYSDIAIAANDSLDYDNLQPWPTIDLPLAGTATVTGHTAIVTVTSGNSSANILRYLPGNLVQIGQQVYRLWARPTTISANIFLFQFIENAGTQSGAKVSIYEPQIANQVLPYLWGPSGDGGVVFGCGDSLRPGTLYFTKNFDPDAAPSDYNIELSEPSEPLLGGAILEGKSFVASSDRWWVLYPNFSNPYLAGSSYASLRRFTPVEAPVGRGLAAPYALCSDGKLIYFWAKDGIYAHSGGIGVSLTDDDLFTLFPREGAQGKSYSYAGKTVVAPDYARALSFRLAVHQGFLYADYVGIDGQSHTLVCDLRHKAWSIDSVPAHPISFHYSVSQPPSKTLSTASPTTYPLLILASSDGTIWQESDSGTDGGAAISGTLASFEWPDGDIRSAELWGDCALDFYSEAAVTIRPYSMGLPTSPAQTFAGSSLRQQGILDMGGGITTQTFGVMLTWSDAGPTLPTTFYAWMPTLTDKPENIAGRYTDWDDSGSPAAKFYQGFLLEADTFNVGKSVQVRDADTLALHPFTGPTLVANQVRHNGQSRIAYSFTNPFVAHSVRLEPAQDSVEWRLFSAQFLSQPTPESGLTWMSQATAHGLAGFQHVRQLEIAHNSAAPLSVILIVDGVAQAPLTVPSSGGVTTKSFVTPAPNKGRLFAYRITSTAPFQIFADDCEIHVGAWNRQDAYLVYRSFGGQRGDHAQV